jgi:hypothetical protein
MSIIRRVNCIDAASGIVTLSKWPSGTQVERELVGLRFIKPDGCIILIQFYFDVLVLMLVLHHKRLCFVERAY